MQVVFIAVAAVGAGYFLMRRRRFDGATLAFFAGLIYFSPGFFGFVLTPVGAFEKVPKALGQEAYLVMIVVLTAVLLAGWVMELVVGERQLGPRVVGASDASRVASVLAVGAFVAMVLTGGAQLLSPDKVEVIEAGGRWLKILAHASAVGAVIGFAQRRRIVVGICMTLLLAMVYLGYRYAFANTIIALGVLYLTTQGPLRLIGRWRLAVAVLGVGVFLILYHHQKALIKTGDWSTLAQRITSPTYWAVALANYEALTTQAVLNETTLQEFRVGTGHFAGMATQLVPFSPEMGAAQESFGELFLPRLFPERVVPIGANIWAEMWSAGGWPLVLIFTGVFVLGLGVATLGLQFRDPVLRGPCALLLSYWAFYIHRNDLAAEMNIIRRVVVVTVFCIVASAIVAAATGRADSHPPSPSGSVPNG